MCSAIIYCTACGAFVKYTVKKCFRRPDRPTDHPPKITNHSVCLRVAKICLTFFDKFGSFLLIRSEAGRTSFKIKKSDPCDSKTPGRSKNLTVTIRLLTNLSHFGSFAQRPARATFKIKKSYCHSKTFGPSKNLTATIRLLATLHHFVSFA